MKTITFSITVECEDNDLALDDPDWLADRAAEELRTLGYTATYLLEVSE